MSDAKAQMIALAQTGSALEAIRKDLIRCGFELEFHAVNGVSREDGSGHSCDEDDCDDCRGASVDNEIKPIPNIEVGNDGSVRGGEIRTLGPLTPTEFMAAASALYDGHSFEIDTGCSFHIHLSVQGVRHVYGKNLQAELMAFLLANQSRLPKTVRNRLNSEAIRFCSFRIQKEKMTAVNGHSQGTWEFRLFGNIQNKHDAWRCLLLAIDALRHAYQVRFNLKPALVTSVIAMDFMNLAEKAIRHEESLAKAVRRETLFSKQQSA